MNISNLSIRRKLLLESFLMIAIPVAVIILLFGAVVLSLLGIAGAGRLPPFSQPAAEPYSILLTLDALGGELALEEESSAHTREIERLCGQLERLGLSVSVRSGSTAVYCTDGTSEPQARALAEEITGQHTAAPLSCWTQEGFAYAAAVPLKAGGEAQIIAVARGLRFPGSAYILIEGGKDLIKGSAVVLCGVAVLLVVLTGVFLTRKTAQSLLQPLSALQKATAAIRDGDLNYAIENDARDELGEVCRDFDAMRLRLQTSLVQQRKAEQGRKEMLAGISHDLSTPLTSIKGYISGILDGVADTPEKQRHYLETAYGMACDMDQMVDSLFLFSKLDMGTVPFHYETVDLTAYFRDYCEEMAPQLLQKKMALSFIAQCPKAPVRIDRVQFGRVVANLLDNSCKYQKEDGGALCITVGEEPKGTVRIAFADNGRGIDPGEAARIFDSFYRADKTRNTQIKGSGLGLAITRQLVEEMGGRIEARGAPGQGLTVTITLPKRKEESDGACTDY
jgi:signal transduction histidine kinase